MGRPKKVKEEVIEVEEVVKVETSNVVQHLDRDPNDTRNLKPAETGFSLND